MDLKPDSVSEIVSLWYGYIIVSITNSTAWKNSAAYWTNKTPAATADYENLPVKNP